MASNKPNRAHEETVEVISLLSDDDEPAPDNNPLPAVAEDDDYSPSESEGESEEDFEIEEDDEELQELLREGCDNLEDLSVEDDPAAAASPLPSNARRSLLDIKSEKEKYSPEFVKELADMIRDLITEAAKQAKGKRTTWWLKEVAALLKLGGNAVEYSQESYWAAIENAIQQANAQLRNLGVVIGICPRAGEYLGTINPRNYSARTHQTLFTVCGEDFVLFVHHNIGIECVCGGPVGDSQTPAGKALEEAITEGYFAVLSSDVEKDLVILPYGVFATKSTIATAAKLKRDGLIREGQMIICNGLTHPAAHGKYGLVSKMKADPTGTARILSKFFTAVYGPSPARSFSAILQKLRAAYGAAKFLPPMDPAIIMGPNRAASNALMKLFGAAFSQQQTGKPVSPDASQALIEIGKKKLCERGRDNIGFTGLLELHKQNPSSHKHPASMPPAVLRRLSRRVYAKRYKLKLGRAIAKKPDDLSQEELLELAVKELWRRYVENKARSLAAEKGVDYDGATAEVKDGFLENSRVFRNKQKNDSRKRRAEARNMTVAEVQRESKARSLAATKGVVFDGATAKVKDDYLEEARVFRNKQANDNSKRRAEARNMTVAEVQRENKARSLAATKGVVFDGATAKVKDDYLEEARVFKNQSNAAYRKRVAGAGGFRVAGAGGMTGHQRTKLKKAKSAAAAEGVDYDDPAADKEKYNDKAKKQMAEEQAARRRKRKLKAPPGQQQLTLDNGAVTIQNPPAGHKRQRRSKAGGPSVQLEVVVGSKTQLTEKELAEIEAAINRATEIEVEQAEEQQQQRRQPQAGEEEEDGHESQGS